MSHPPKLEPGNELRVLALSRSLGGMIEWIGTSERDIAFATARLEAMGLKVTFGRHVRECNAHLTASPKHRLEDLHEAIADPAVKAILAVSGGAGAAQILDGMDYDLIAEHPKIICGYSDVSFPGHAILARTGVTTYYGPNFTSFMMQKGAEYMLERFRECLFDDGPREMEPASEWSDDPWHRDQANRTFHAHPGWWSIQPGEAEGRLVAGSLWATNMLQGSSYFPPLRDAILFLEHPAEGKSTLITLDSCLRALAFQPEFSGVRGIVLGRYGRNGGVTREDLAQLLRQIRALRGLPILANCDFGHTTPIATLPNGGRCRIVAGEELNRIVITAH